MLRWQKASWIETLDLLPGLNLHDKARARVIILSKPREDRELYFEGTYAEAVATIRVLLKETPRGSLGAAPLRLQGGTDSSANAWPAAASLPSFPASNPLLATATAAVTTAPAPTSSGSTGQDDSNSASGNLAAPNARFNMGAINATTLSRATRDSAATPPSSTPPRQPPDASPGSPKVPPPEPNTQPSAALSSSSGLRVRWAADTPQTASISAPSQSLPPQYGTDMRPAPLPPPPPPWWLSDNPGASNMADYKPSNALAFASPSTSGSNSPRGNTTPTLRLTIYSLTTGLGTKYDPVTRLPLQMQPSATSTIHNRQNEYHQHQQQEQLRQQLECYHQQHLQNQWKQSRKQNTKQKQKVTTNNYSRPLPFAPPPAFDMAYINSTLAGLSSSYPSSSSSSSSPICTAGEVLFRTATTINHLSSLPTAFRAAYLKNRKPGDIYCRTTRKVLQSSATGRTIHKTIRYMMLVDIHDRDTAVLVRVRPRELGRQLCPGSYGSVSLCYRAEVVPEPEDSYDAISTRLDRRAVKMTDIVMWREVPQGWALWDGKQRVIGIEFEPHGSQG